MATSKTPTQKNLPALAAAALLALAGSCYAVPFEGTPEVSYDGEIRDCVALDADSDGDDDLALWVHRVNVVTLDDRVVLARNTNGTPEGFVLEDIGQASGTNSSWTRDVTGDGHNDFCLGTALFISDGEGGFRRVPLPPGTGSTAPIDADNDGDIDLVASSGALLENISGFEAPMRTHPTFGAEGVGARPMRLAAGKWGVAARSGRDVGVLTPGSGPFDLLVAGVGTVTGAYNYEEFYIPEPHVGDFNGDGLDDIALGDLPELRAYLNPGGPGPFQEQLLTNFTSVVDMTIADLDEDGVDEVLACTRDGKVAFYQGTAFGQESALTFLGSSYFGVSVATFDLDGDGGTDVFSGGRNTFRIWRNTGTPAPTPTPSPTASPSPTPEPEPICPDLNGDGNVDVADLLGVLLATF